MLIVIIYKVKGYYNLFLRYSLSALQIPLYSERLISKAALTVPSNLGSWQGSLMEQHWQETWGQEGEGVLRAFISPASSLLAVGLSREGYGFCSVAPSIPRALSLSSGNH